MTVKELMAKLAECHPDEEVWVTVALPHVLTTPDERFTVEAVTFEDDDCEIARAQGRQKYGVPYLRAPILHIETNS